VSVKTDIVSALSTAIALVLLALLILSALHVMTPPWAVVGSYSMVPTLEIGDIVILVPPPASPSQLLGKVVVYTPPGIPWFEIVHRVVKVQGDHIVTKGDANPVPDVWKITIHNVRGVVVLAVPHIGLLALAVKTAMSGSPGGVVLCMLGLLYMIVLYFLSKIVEH